MIHSMTGFGRAEGRAANRPVVVEIRSVNSRFRDTSVRSPKGYASAEEFLKKRVGQRLSRGRVEIFLQVDESTAEPERLKLDVDLARTYLGHLDRLRDELGLDTGRPGPLDLIGLKGVVVFEDAGLDWEIFLADLGRVADEALDNLVGMRQTEGAALAADLLARLEAMRETTARISDRRQVVVDEVRTRLEARIRALTEGLDLDPGRLAQEVAYIADRSDITEELVRLASHFDQFGELVGSSGTAGRRFEFLLQEINREVNTIGSKTNDVTITNHVLDLKTELEKLREQVQNVE
jgi:uncharacterized protein (TIGR00255 family)